MGPVFRSVRPVRSVTIQEAAGLRDVTVASEINDVLLTIAFERSDQLAARMKQEHAELRSAHVFRGVVNGKMWRFHFSVTVLPWQQS